MKEYQGLPCVVCGSEETTADHIKPIGMGGNNPNANEKYNMMPLCFTHHREKEDGSVRDMANDYKVYKKWLMDNDWEFDNFDQKWKHYGV